MWRGMNVTGVDGFVTTEPSVIMMIRTADCVPLVLYDPAHHAMALLHAGWRGTVKGMATTGLAGLVKEYQTDPRQVLVWLGPAARVCHLTFPEIPSEFEHELWQPYLKINFQSVAVDLIAYIKATLHQAGVKKSSMVDSHLCTVELPELFSHRRSQADGSPAGRLAVVAKLK